MTDRYGNDFVLYNGDLIVSDAGDLFTAKEYESKVSNKEPAPFVGYYNMIFSLTTRILSLRKDNVFHYDYGSNVPNLISSPNSTSLKSNIKAEITNALSEDERVKSVDSVVVEQQGNVISVKAMVVLVGQNQVSTFIFPNFLIE